MTLTPKIPNLIKRNNTTKESRDVPQGFRYRLIKLKRNENP